MLRDSLSLSIRRTTLAAIPACFLLHGAGVSAELALEEVVVTAQKRAENMQEIPIAVSALDESALETSGFDGVNDLSYMVPSLQFGNFGPVAFVAIRGIGMENTTAGGDPGVAMHLDGVYIGRPVGSLFTAFDTERVEVLRGPQGTLYGRNATGGSINLITRKPGDEFEGEIEATLGDYNLRQIRGAVNLPISESVSARVVAFNEERDGYTENSVPGGTDANDADNYGLRSHVSFDINDSASFLLSASYVKNGGVGTQAEVREAYPQTLAGPPIPGTVDFVLDGETLVNDQRPFKEAKGLRESQDNEFVLVSGTLDWDFDNFSIKSITAYGESEFESHQDTDSSEKALGELVLTENAEQFSQEIQLISDTGGDLRWIGGLYYFKEKGTRYSTFYESRFDIIAGLNGTEAGVKLGGDVETTSWAVFAQGTYDINDKVAVTLGLRYTDDEKEGTNKNILFGPEFVDEVAVDSQEVTGKLSFDWKFSEDSMLYASLARGYKSGGINQVAIVSAGRDAVYDPEFVDTLEVGLKSRLLDDRLQLNVSAYTNDYSDLQFQVFQNSGPAAGNAGEATVNGLEVELQALLSEIWAIDASAGFMDSEYETLVFDVNGDGIDEDYSGNELTRSPELTYSLGVTGNWDFNSGSLRLRLEGSYTDEIYYAFLNREGDRADDYTNVNLRLHWTSQEEKFTAELFATNLTDEVQEGNVLRGIGFMDCAGCGGQEFVTYNAPRQVGVTLGYKF
ncbi:TonB-dependent receptor [Pseudomaricurvus alkylphenolicus]|uniref:TonB-dependent receptor n=1 Tax=Pseudomaricurvus alkylphenolicus TaxID=1306991 RepID=UPI001421307C|nr:TonB-dependent receptor [Pseudomaricurvus alkylphenolicus]NIB38522.1 TonB-dependent receptor [Pseudomaricurvus alkylphenolicus]